MRQYPFTPLFLLTLLVLAALACSTVTGGLSGSDAQATADALEEQFDDLDAQVEATAAAAEATAEAALDSLNDNGDDNDNNNGNENDNANENDGDDNGNASGDDDPFEGQGPDDIPVFTGAGEPALVLANDNSLTYNVGDTDVDEVADFYREAMPDAGWDLAEDGDLELGLATTLTYEKDGRSAVITISALFDESEVTVAVFVQ